MPELIVLSIILLAVWVGSALAMHWLCRQIALGRLERNTWVGTRTSWTLASDEAWHAAHRASLPAYRWAAWLSTAAAAATAAVAAAGVVGVVTPETGVQTQGILALVVCVVVLVVVLASLRPARRAVDALDALRGKDDRWVLEAPEGGAVSQVRHLDQAADEMRDAVAYLAGLPQEEIDLHAVPVLLPGECQSDEPGAHPPAADS